MANYANPFVAAQGTDTSQGYMTGAGSGWADYSGASGAQMFQQMLPSQTAAGTWFPNQSYSDAMWYASQAGYADASMFSTALAAKLQSSQSDQLWLQPMAQQMAASATTATAPQAQMLQQQVMQRQLQMQNQSQMPATSTPDPSGKGTHPAKTTTPPKAPPPPGISGTTPLKAGTSVANASDKSAALKAVLNPANKTERPQNEAGAKAGQFLLNLVNRKEDGPGAILLQQLKGGPTRGGKPAADLSSLKTDNGAGMALLQQVKAGSPVKEAEWQVNKGRQSAWWGGDASYYDDSTKVAEWDEWRKGGKPKGKKGKNDWAGWGGNDWWSRNAASEEWSEEYGTWNDRSTSQWGRSRKGGKGKTGPSRHHQEEEEEEEEEEESSASDESLPKAGANSRWRQRKATDGKGKGSGRGKGQSVAEPKPKQKWKPAAKSSK